jgi:hypothetical protein
VLDWNEVVRERNDRGNRSLSEEVIAEIATHLEESYEHLRLQGLGEAEAVESALRSLADWRSLNRAIRKSRHAWRIINQRTSQLWIPGLATLLATNLLLLVFMRAGMAWFPKTGPAGAYLVWLSTQPFIGALGAHLSQRAGGLRTARLIAGLFPSIVTAGLGLFLMPLTFLLDRNTWASAHPALFVIGGVVWLAPAAIGLFCGALPFLELRTLTSESILPRTAQT